MLAYSAGERLRDLLDNPKSFERHVQVLLDNVDRSRKALTKVELQRLMHMVCNNLCRSKSGMTDLGISHDISDCPQLVAIPDFLKLYKEWLARIVNFYHPDKLFKVTRQDFVDVDCCLPKGQASTLFRKIKHLGQGTFGKVSLVQDARTGHAVVLKEVRFAPHIYRTRELFVQMVRSEVNFLRLLDHPNILKVYDFWHVRVREILNQEEDMNTLYITSEFCNGTHVKSLIEDTAAGLQVDQGERNKRIMWQLFYGLHYIHGRRIIHKWGISDNAVCRDLKPENVMLKMTSHGNFHVKIVDFGLAEGDDHTKGMSGTVLYSAPEKCPPQHIPKDHPNYNGRRKLTYDSKYDIWAAGVIMFELLAGCSPFLTREQARSLKNGSTVSFTVKHIWRQVLTGPLWDHLPKTTISRAYSLLRLLLQQDPERRPSAITALKHPYFTDINVALNSALVIKGIQPSLAGNLRAFQHHSSQKAALIVLMAHLSDDVSEEINQIADLFMVLDRDRDGDLSRTEMAAGLRECGVSPASVHNILRAVDLNGSGRVQYTQFVAACFTFSAAHLQLLNAAFCKSDEHGNGALSLEEFKQMLAGPKKASELPAERTKMMYDRIAGGKKITFKDIVHYLHND